VTTDAIAEAIESYLRTGSYDPIGAPWPGNIIERSRRAHDALIQALVTEVTRRAKTRPAPELAQGFDGVAFTRAKVEPMVCGLFPRVERQAVLALLERAVVFLTPANLELVLRHERWLDTAWDLANLYLGSIGAEPLGESAPGIVGLSEETTCFVSMQYFSESDPFADFVVHEVAHVFHNCKRDAVGLSATRRREWLLDIDYRKRETFAYACEAYARIVGRARDPAGRVALARAYGGAGRISEVGVDPSEVADILREAGPRRNGWKVILAHCAPPMRSPAREGRTEVAEA
jgi:hypothetical protein